MSLLSVQNLTMPLKNTTHVITLILVAGLFGSYRYAGGALSTGAKDSIPPPAAVQAPADEEIAAEEEAGAVEKHTRAPGAESPKKLLDEMIGRNGSKKEHPDGSKEQLKTTLDDIEKQLGLR